MNNIFTKFFQKKEINPQVVQDLIGWHTHGNINPLKYYRDNQYENGYGSIQAITKQFFATIPFAVDAKGKQLRQSNIVDVLGHPNKDMSGLDFREALAVMTLVHDKVYIKVWHKGNRATESNIFGFTFIENCVETDLEDGRTSYTTLEGETLYDNEVIVIKNINPYDLSLGYSTANAAKRWARIDDYIASYQSGFFENGAIPSGQFLISAPTAQEFEDIVRNLKAKHRGADKNNNVIYDYAPLDPVTGKATTGSITWVPFNSTNKDLELPALFEQVNKKIDSAYGVPASMRGDNDNNTYASVRIDQEIFIDNAVRPFTMKIWTRFTHELNRITGGLGYAISFDIETPHIAEEDEAVARTEQTTIQTLLSLIDKGFTLESAVKALGLPESYLLLDRPEPIEEPVIEETETPQDEASIDEGDEVEESPDQEEKKLDPLSINCKHCGRYLFKSTGTTIVEDMPCPKCKATNNFKIINPLGDDITHKFTFEEKAPRDWKVVANSKQLSDEETALITDKIEASVRHLMERQISRVDLKSKALSDIDNEDVQLYAEEILSTVQPLITSEGMKQYLLARTLEGIQGENLTIFRLDEKQVDKYRSYLQHVLKSYSEDTQDSIKKVLDSGVENNLPKSDVQKNLSNVMNTDEWRVKRIALTETNRAGNNGQAYAMEQVAKDEKITIHKVWQAQAGECALCQSLDGKEVGISETFMLKGEEITDADGNKYKNDFMDIDVATIHPNCKCYMTYKVIKD